MPGATDGNTKWPVRPALIASGSTLVPLDCGTGSSRTTVRASGRPEACSKHDSLDSACLHTDGGGQQSKHSVHSQCYDGFEVRGVE